jgi:hypothetical protein
MNHLWYVYLTAAVITHLIHLSVYMKSKPPGSWPWRKELFMFYFSDPEAQVTTAGTIGIVWVLGSCYIDKLNVTYLSSVVGLPGHPGIAFLLGFMGEYFGSRIIKVIYRWLVPGGE